MNIWILPLILVFIRLCRKEIMREYQNLFFQYRFWIRNRFEPSSSASTTSPPSAAAAMCSTSQVNEMLGSLQTDSSSKAPEVSAIKFQHSRDTFFLVDIREPDEISESPLPRDMTADAAMPMGKLLHMARNNKLEEWKQTKKIVLLCGSGYRSSLAAKELAAEGFHAAALCRGLIGLLNPAATVPDLLVVLGTKSSPEKLTLALNACAVAAAANETVVLALMGDGVCTFLRKGNNKEEASPTSVRVENVFVGEPFQPCNVLLQKFGLTGNGVILACTSCVKSRKLEFGSDLLDCVAPMQMPDLLRMLGEAKKSLQFM